MQAGNTLQKYCDSNHPPLLHIPALLICFLVHLIFYFLCFYLFQEATRLLGVIKNILVHLLVFVIGFYFSYLSSSLHYSLRLHNNETGPAVYGVLSLAQLVNLGASPR